MEPDSFDDKQKAWRRLMKDVFKRGERVDSLLDVPCGRGELFRYARKRAKRYWGIDPDLKNIQSARVRCTGGKVSLGDPLNMKLPSGRFDVVMSWGLIPTVREHELEAAIRELFRLSSKYVLFNWYGINKRDEKMPEEKVPKVMFIDGRLYVRGKHLSRLLREISTTGDDAGIWQYGPLESVGEFESPRWVSLFRKW